MAHETHKMVVLPSSGPIFPKGGINGPILTPYREDVKTIGVLLMRGYRVLEVLHNDVRVELNLSNFDHNNGALSEEEEASVNAQIQEAQRLAAEEAARKLREEAAQQLAEEEAQREAEQKLAEEAAQEAAKQAEEEAVVEPDRVELKAQRPQQKNQLKNNHKHVQADKVNHK